MKAMIEVFIFLGVCTFMAIIYDKSVSKEFIEEDGRFFLENHVGFASNVVFFILLAIMVCFAGLRTTMNDTATYLYTFSYKIEAGLSSIKNISWSVGDNPLFQIYEIIVKTLISESGYGFLFITSLIVVSSLLLFLKKYAIRFDIVVFLFISFTVYAFTMAAIKQTLATAIVVWSIPLWLERKRVRAILLVLFAMLIHPYVLIYFAAFFLADGIWNKKTVVIVVITVAAGALFNSFVSGILNLVSTMGDDYSAEMFIGNGVSRSRLLVYMVIPVMSFIYRSKIRELNNQFYNICINLSIVSTCFMFIASFGGAIMFGRMANYFDVFTCLSIPLILEFGMEESQLKGLVKFCLIVGFLYFYYTYFSKYFTIESTCFYNHISLWTLLQSW